MRIIRITKITDKVLIAFKSLMPQLSAGLRPPSKQNLEEIINSENSVLFIAQDEDKEIAGTLTLIINRIPTKQFAWIEDIVIDNKFRGKGVGQKLTQHAIDYAIKKGINEINLTSNSKRIAANKLYQKLGFVTRDTNVYRLTVG
ncbi:MAG: GNAT family N-acetyltransferase [Draconibacterium sp.]|nr:GNAT family N-acetyltransferase [Draconibacterium sp.]